MKEQQWALVTGASSGLGREFARCLARRKINVVLTARREAPMLELAEKLRQREGVEVVVEQLDLAQANQAMGLRERLEARGVVPTILINNAGYGFVGTFHTQALDQVQQMLQVDVVSLVELTHVFGEQMYHRGEGSILLVASLAAFQPTPLMAAYGAAKHFVLAFGEALHVEFAPKVGVTVVCPGLMETEFFQVSGYKPKPGMQRSMVTPAEVAEAGLRAMFQGRSSVVMGRINRFAAFSTRFLPRRLQAKLAYRMTKD